MTTAELDAARRKLLWRATHRGIKEMDLIVGTFALAHLSNMNDNEIKELEKILEIPDQDLLSWLTSQSAVPAEHDSKLLRALLATRIPTAT